MATEKQIKANKQNAQLGGVKTKKGKDLSRLNALKYGFFSKIVTEYDKLDHQDFCKAMHDCFEPQTVYEEQLVEILLSHLLTYRRISLVEQERIKLELNPKITREVMSVDYIDYSCSLSQTETLKEGYTPKIGCAIIDQLDKIQRYKTATLNQILRAQHELERLQRIRKGEQISAPSVSDISVSMK